MVVGRENHLFLLIETEANFPGRGMKTLTGTWSVLGTQIALRETRYPEVDIKSRGSSKRKGKLMSLGRTHVQSQKGPKGVAYCRAIIRVSKDDWCMRKVPYSRAGTKVTDQF